MEAYKTLLAQLEQAKALERQKATQAEVTNQPPLCQNWKH